MLESIAFLLQNPWLVAFALGFLPLSEVRGAVAYALYLGRPELILAGIAGNLLVAPAVLLLWDAINIPWWGRKILGESLNARLKKFVSQNEKFGNAALVAYIAIPLPVTGVYTGTLLGYLIGIKRKWIFLASVIGVLIAAAISYAVVSGVLAGLPLV